MVSRRFLFGFITALLTCFGTSANAQLVSGTLTMDEINTLTAGVASSTLTATDPNPATGSPGLTFSLSVSNQQRLLNDLSAPEVIPGGGQLLSKLPDGGHVGGFWMGCNTCGGTDTVGQRHREDYDLSLSVPVTSLSMLFGAINNNEDGQEEIQNIRVFGGTTDMTSSVTFAFIPAIEGSDATKPGVFPNFVGPSSTTGADCDSGAAGGGGSAVFSTSPPRQPDGTGAGEWDTRLISRWTGAGNGSFGSGEPNTIYGRHAGPTGVAGRGQGAGCDAGGRLLITSAVPFDSVTWTREDLANANIQELFAVGQSTNDQASNGITVGDFVYQAAPAPRDYGDAPDTGAGTGPGNYNTTLADNGASRLVRPGSNSRLGSCVDADDGTLQNGVATADELDDGAVEAGDCTAVADEDGVTFPAILVPGSEQIFSVEGADRAECFLDAWIDFNQNGSFIDSGEQVITDQFLTGATPSDFSVPIPPTAADGTTYARFICTDGTSGNLPTGQSDRVGEVEDYQVTIAAPVMGSIQVDKTVSGGTPLADWTFLVSSTNCSISGTVETSQTVPAGGGSATFTELLVRSDGSAAGGEECLYNISEVGQNGFSIDLDTTTLTSLEGLTVSDGGTTNVPITNEAVAQCAAGTDDLGGNVFRDYNSDGADAGDNEPGVDGITVNAYDNDNNLVASTRVQPDGSYNFDDILASFTDIRIEFVDLPDFLRESFAGANSGTATQFHSSGTCSADFGVLNPGEYCDDDPTMGLSCFANGDPANSEVGSIPAFYEFSYDSAGAVDPSTSSGQPVDPVEAQLAVTENVGTVWGLTFRRQDDAVLMASIMKRHAGLYAGADTSNSVSTIFRATKGVNDSAGVWLDGAAVGINADVSAATNPVTTVTEVPDNATRGLGGTGDTSLDADVFPLVGKVGFGDMDISDDGKTVYVVNLADRKLYAIDYASVTASNVANFASIDIPQANCENGLSRPWGLDIHDGKVYVGAVCSGELEPDKNVVDLDDEASRLSAQVYELTPDADPAAGTVGTFNQTPVLSASLDYNGADNANEFTREKGCTGALEACQWAPWLDEYSDAAMFTPFGDFSRPQPILSDIIIDEGGFMVLGFMDRSGHQMGWNNRRANGQPGTIRVPTGGDILLAAPDGSGGWTLEQNGTAGNRTSGGNGNGSARGQGGPNTNQGPGGGEFFADDFIRTFHAETTQGGLVQLPGSQEVGTIKQDPFSVRSGGISWSSLTTGLDNRAYEILPEQSQTATQSGFGKANSLGDMELFCALAPIEIGNRVWVDANANGVQDPNEDIIAGVEVQLFEWNDANNDGVFQDTELVPTPVATATTSATGEYYFGPRSGDPSLGTIDLDPNTKYVVAIDDTQAVLASFPQLSPITPDVLDDATGATDTGTSAATNDEHDSNGLTGVLDDLIIAPVMTGEAGDNDHSIDFGFVPAIDFGDAPASYGTLAADSGAQHAIVPGLNLGTLVDSELDGFDTVNADGDDLDGIDDEDGIDIAAQAQLPVADATGAPTTSYTLTDVGVTNTTGADAFLVAYIDFNGDGDFDDPGERSDPTTVSPGDTVETINFSDISDINVGDTYVRLRLSSDQAAVLSPTGAAPDGEVEDYPISILPVVQSVKVLVPAANPNAFDLEINTTPPTVATGGNTTETAFVPFTPGAASPLTLSETNLNDSIVEDGVFVTQAICRDGNGTEVLVGNSESLANGGGTGAASVLTSDFTLAGATAAQNTITCTWTNLAAAFISVVKESAPATDTNFTFTTVWDGGSEDPLGDFGLTGNTPANQVAEMATIPGDESRDLTVAETAPDGWAVNGVNCVVADAGGTVDVAVGTPTPAVFPAEQVSIQVTGIQQADTVNCTFTNIQLVSVGSTVWVESPNTPLNGIQDAGEVGIADATVTLLNADGSPANDAFGNLATTTTDLSGQYFFNDLLPGDYLVQVDLDAGNTATGVGDLTNLVPTSTQVPAPNNDVNLDSNIDLNSAQNDAPNQVWTSGVITLSAGGEPTDEADTSGTPGSDQPGQASVDDNTGNMTIDFGFYEPYSLGSVVFSDDNDSGIQEAGEDGIAGARVRLFEADGTTEIPVGPDGILGTADDATGGVFTGTDGEYNFSGLPQGSYVVNFTKPAGGFIPSSVQEADPNTDTNLDSNLLVTDPNDASFNTAPVVLGGNEPSGETGLAGLDADPSGTADARGNMTIDAGFAPLMNLGNLVFNDRNNDSVYDAAIDSLVSGAVVSLLIEDSNNPGSFIPATDAFGAPAAPQTTQGDGLYNFENLVPGNYQVAVSIPDSLGLSPVATQQGDPNTNTDNDSNIDTTTVGAGETTYTSGTVTLSGGDEPEDEEGAGTDGSNGNLTVDFGFFEPLSLGSVVYNDNNVNGVNDASDNNGLQDVGEPGINGSIVSLFRTPDGGTTLTPVRVDADGVYDPDQGSVTPTENQVVTSNSISGVTLPDGSYNFSGLPADDYVIQVTPPTGFSPAANQNPDPTDDVNLDSNLNLSVVTVPAGTWQSGVVELRAAGGPILGSENDPLGAQETDPSGINTTNDSNGDLSVDFGFSALTSLGSTIWLDTDLEGDQDAGEPAIEGATVTLLNSDGSIFDADPATPGDQPLESITTTDGEYNFNSLPPGDYRVQVDLSTATNFDGTKLRASPVQVADPENNENGDSNVDAAAPGQDIPNSIYQSGIVNLAVGEEPEGETDNIGTPGADQPNQGAGDLDANGNMTVDMGFYPTGTIGDLVLVDIDGDGVLDPADGDAGIGGVTVTLEYNDPLNGGAPTTLTSVTSLDGSYSFEGLPGDVDYTVTVDTSTLPGTLDTDIRASFDADGGLDNTSMTSLNFDGNGEVVDDLDQDFGYVPLGAIGDTIWFDTNRDGIQDPGESGIPNITVQLTPVGGTPITTQTGPDGTYLFMGLPVGEYEVEIIGGLLPEYTQTGDPDTVFDNTSTVTLAQNPANATEVIGNLDQDFGYVEPVSIGSFVWQDLNADGIQDDNEPPIAGATLALAVDDGSGNFVPARDLVGNLVLPITSAANGSYIFDNLLAGDYKVSVTPPSGLFPSLVQNTADNDVNPTDSNIAGEPTPGNFESGVFTLAAGVQPVSTATETARGDAQDGSATTSARDESGNMTVDFGFIQSASIGNYVWLDLDMDGAQDANEDGLANVTVNLLVDSNGNGVIDGNELVTPAATATTGPNGEYLFPNLEPGVVYVTAVDPSTVLDGLVQTFDEGPGGAIGTLDNTSDPIVLSPGEEHLTADFGYAPPDGTGTIGDRIWIDADGVGDQDTGEPGIGNVTVTLIPPSDIDLGSGLGVPIETITDSSGRYLFTDLPLNETYIVEVDVTTLPPGYTSDPSGSGDPDVRDGESSVPDDRTTVVLSDDMPVNLDADFGYRPDDSVNNTIGETIWRDLNEDGVVDADEPSLPGVTVTLLDISGNPVATTITDQNGMYMFTGVPDGTYMVVVTDQNNVLDGLSQTHDGDDPANPGSYTPSTPNVSTVTDLGVGVDTPVMDTDQNFGYIDSSNTGGPGQIGDTIFIDADQDGALDDGEGVEGVTVKLIGVGPDGIAGNADDELLDTAVTDENGNYLFTGIDIDAAGSDFTVMVDVTTLPNDGDGLTNSVFPPTGGDSMNVVSLTPANPIDLDQDFGYTSEDMNRLEGNIWPDTDGDGEQDESGGVGGVTVELRDPDGNVVQTVTTDMNGDYTFVNLPDGLYTVVVTDDGNVLSSFEHTDSPNGTSDTGDMTSKDDTGYVVDLDSAGVLNSPVTDTTSDFGYMPVVTNPISLGSFSATRVGEAVQFAWSTQTEVANLGFMLYGYIGDEWVALNDSLILSRGDSVSIQSYSLELETSADIFVLSDVDLTGSETLHGPYRVGESYGMIGERQRIDWQGEQAERAAKQAAREALRKAQQRERNQQRKQRRLKSGTGDKQETSMLDRLFNKALAGAVAVLIPTAHAAQSDGAPGEDVVNLTTTSPGLHQVTAESLFGSEVDLDGTPVVDIALMNQGAPVPIQVEGSTDDASVFGPGSVIRFLAEDVDTLYSDTNVYTLRLDQDDAQRMTPQTVVPSGAAANAYLAKRRYAPQAKYSFVSPDVNDPWYAKRIVAVRGSAEEVMTLNLDHVATGGNSGNTRAKLKVKVWGSTDLVGSADDHHVKVSMNGREVAASRFDGLSAKQLDSTLDSVNNGNNQVKVTLPGDTGYQFDAVNVNEVEISYPRQFMAEDNRLDFESTYRKFRIQGLDPQALPGQAADLMVVREDSTGVYVMNGASVACRVTCLVEVGGTGELAHYYVAAKNNIESAQIAALPVDQDIQSGDAAYLIISHPDFIGAAGGNQLETLATELAGEYGSADVVDVEAIYAQYGYHVFDPQAIQAYIQDAVNNRSTEVVLLVGGDVYDYRQFENEDATSFIPSIYAATGNNISFAPVDAKYVDLDNDNVPDLPIGRLPVRTAAQLSSLLSKRASYQARTYTGKVLLVADEYDAIQQYDFAGDADEVEAEFLDGFAVSKAYVTDDVSTDQARAALTNYINEGQTLTAFFGHSSTNQWSFNGLLTGNDAANLNNVGRPTIVTQWGCWNAYYVSPNEDSMGHRFMMEGDQGAVAVMGASTLTNANSERILARLVFERLGNGERLGEAVTNAKQEYAQEHPDDLDVLLGWTLLGLPELVIN